MPKRKRTKKVRLLLQAQIHPHAAGIDISATEMMVAVPPGGVEQPVQAFGTTTSDLASIRDHLLAHGVTSVAMESTGLYWMALYDVLEQAGLTIFLVNARHVKNVPGRKSDVCDAQWLQQLHTAGLLRGGFRPAAAIRQLRDLMRERGDYIEQSSHQILMIQRCFDQMNVLLHRVIRNVDGSSGLRIIEAILGGERDAKVLEKLRDVRCQKSKAEVIKALQGNWDEDCVKRMGRAYQTWRLIQEHLSEISQRIEALIAQVETPLQTEALGKKKSRDYVLTLKAKRGSKTFELPTLQAEAARLLGTDLMAIGGVSHTTLSVLLSEVGTAADLKTHFPTCKQFTSWLGLCPDNNVSGGKVLGSKTRHVNHRLAGALRMCAFGLWRSSGGLGDYCRKMKARLGKAEGITATAHKLARIIYTLVTTGAQYDESIVSKTSPAALERKIANVRKRAKSLGFELVARP